MSLLAEPLPFGRGRRMALAAQPCLLVTACQRWVLTSCVDSPPHPTHNPAHRYYQMAHMREEKIGEQPSLLRPPVGAALREYQVRRWHSM